MILLHAQGSSSTHWRWTTIPFYDNPRPPTGMPTIELTRRPPKPMAWNQTQHFGLLDPSKRKFEFRVSSDHSSVVLQIAGDAFAPKFKSNLQKKLETDGKFSLVWARQRSIDGTADSSTTTKCQGKKIASKCLPWQTPRLPQKISFLLRGVLRHWIHCVTNLTCKREKGPPRSPAPRYYFMRRDLLRY